MKHVPFLLAAGALVLASCTDSPFTPFGEADFEFTQGVSGPTFVFGQFTLGGNGGGGGTAGVNKHPQGQGDCRDADGNIGQTETHTIWYNSQGKKTNAKFCQGSAGGPGAETTCTFEVLATYAQLTNNENLNFNVEQSAEYDEVTNPNPDLFVHYRGQQNDTRGRGVLNFTYACEDDTTGDGSLALVQFAENPGNLFVNPFPPYAHGLEPPSGGVELFTDHGTVELDWLAWDYRQAVGL